MTAPDLSQAIADRLIFLSIAKDAPHVDMDKTLADLWPLTTQGTEGENGVVVLESDEEVCSAGAPVPLLIYRCAGIEITIHPEHGVEVREVAL